MIRIHIDCNHPKHRDEVHQWEYFTLLMTTSYSDRYQLSPPYAAQLSSRGKSKLKQRPNAPVQDTTYGTALYLLPLRAASFSSALTPKASGPSSMTVARRTSRAVMEVV